MKISPIRKLKERASALLTTLVICSILSIFVMYYLSLIDQQSYLSARSQMWNMAISISEAGVEEGMQQLNSNYPDMNTDGWTYNGSTYFWKSNTLAGGNSYVSYIFITNSFNPLVVARAYVTMPPKYGMNRSSRFLAAIGMNFTSPTGASDAIVTRAIQCSTAKHSLFLVAMVAKKNIDLKGNGILTDSFDSSLPGIKSDANGQYTASLAGDKGDVATNLGVIDSIEGGNANIYGHAHTGPGSQSTALQIGGEGYVGAHADLATVGLGHVDPGWWLPDANFTFPETSMPNTAGYMTPPSGYVLVVSNYTATYATNTTFYPNPAPLGGVTILCGGSVNSFSPPLIPCCSSVTNNNNGTKSYVYSPITGYSYTFSQTYTYYFTNQYDHILFGSGTLALGGNGTQTSPYIFTPSTSGQTNYFVASDFGGSSIVLGSNVVLALPNGLNMGGGDSVTITKGANLIAFCGGSSANISGQGIVNQPGVASSMIFICAPTVTTLGYSGNGQFNGCIVAPSADISMNGSGSGSLDFCGAVIGNSVTMNGHFKFHYDEALAGRNKDGRFLITGWNEIK